MIEFQNLSKTFRVHQKEPGLKGSIHSLFRRKWIEKHALREVTARVEPGEILGLVGANGAGKTTLVKILSGIVHPTSGSASVLGFTPWERKNEFRRQVALIMGQKSQLWWDLPAGDCFLLLREIYCVPPARFKKTLDYLVQSLGVENQLKIQIRRLSLGERMKMELIAALLHEPKVVFLDEPTIGLDLTAQKAIRSFLLEYRKSHRPAMILTSHYMEDIERLCERILIIRDGAFVYDGPLARVLTEGAQYKIITARLAPDADPESLSQGISKEHGERVPSESGTLKLKVPRPKVPEAAAEILRRFPVADLNIEEEDIGTIIEKLLQREAR